MESKMNDNKKANRFTRYPIQKFWQIVLLNVFFYQSIALQRLVTSYTYQLKVYKKPIHPNRYFVTVILFLLYS